MTQTCNSWSKSSKQVGQRWSPDFLFLLYHITTLLMNWPSQMGRPLVIPRGMRSQIRNDVHSGHQGIKKCLRQAREHVFWPGIKMGQRMDTKLWNMQRIRADMLQATTHEPRAFRDNVGEDWNWSVFLPWKWLPCYCVLQIQLLGFSTLWLEGRRNLAFFFSP